MGKQAGDFGDSDEVVVSEMKTMVMLWIYFESRANRLTDRLNVDCKRKYRVRDIIFHCYIKFTGLKIVLFVISSNLSWAQFSGSVWGPRWLLHLHIRYISWGWLEQLWWPSIFLHMVLLRSKLRIYHSTVGSD